MASSNQGYSLKMYIENCEGVLINYSKVVAFCIEGDKKGLTSVILFEGGNRIPFLDIPDIIELKEDDYLFNEDMAQEWQAMVINFLETCNDQVRSLIRHKDIDQTFTLFYEKLNKEADLSKLEKTQMDDFT